MSIKRKAVDDDIIDVDAIASTYVDEDIIDVDEVTDVKIDKSFKMVEDEPETIEDFIEKAMARQEKTVNNAMKTINKRVDQHERRLSVLEKQQKEILKKISASPDVSNSIDEDDSEPEVDDRNVFDKTLGAVGGVMHGIVDTAAFVLESTVDLVTLGRARRD